MSNKIDSIQLNKTPTWITQDNVEFLKKPDFQRIVRFFVINAPDVNVCARGKEIENDGKELLSNLLGSIPEVHKQNIGVPEIAEANLINFPPSVLEERVCFAASKDKPVTGLFIHIRNSLAHGRFNFGGNKKVPYLIMEDINSREKCSARMVLKFSTLRAWIDRFEG